MSNRTKMIIKEILSYVVMVIVAVILAKLIDSFIIINAKVPTGSMIPTIQKSDRIIGNRLSYNKEDPKRGDIIIFPFPDDENELYIKRIIGMPGETVEIHDGKVFINGSELDESAYLDTTTKGKWGPYIVPVDSYFVMGDNRNLSEDSRYWKNKYVSRDKILAKAVFKYYKGFGKLN